MTTKEKLREEWANWYSKNYSWLSKLAEQKELPMGISQWKEYGKKYGYWEYFESEVKKEIIEKIQKLPTGLTPDGEYRWVDVRELKKLITKLNEK